MQQTSMLISTISPLSTFPSAIKSTQTSTKSILDTLRSDMRFEKLVHALDTSRSLTDDLTAGSNITFFAPTNQAFQSLDKDIAGVLENILRYHCVDARIAFADMADGKTIESKLYNNQLGVKKQRIRVFKCSLNGSVSLNMFARIQEYDLKALNGIVHVIDRVMLPPTDIFKSLNYLPTKFSIWLLAVERTGMQQILKEQVGMTCFVPTNNAWMNLGQAALSHLFSPRSLQDLKRIVEFHLATQLIYADELISKKHVQIETLLKGESIEVNVEEMKKGESSMMNFGWETQEGIMHHDGGVNPNCSRILLNRGESRVVLTDALCENGNVFVISNVMVPEGLCVE